MITNVSFFFLFSAFRRRYTPPSPPSRIKNNDELCTFYDIGNSIRDKLKNTPAVRDDGSYAFDQFLFGHPSIVQSNGHAFFDTVGDVRLLIAEHRHAYHRHPEVHGLHDAHQSAMRYKRLDVFVTCEHIKIVSRKLSEGNRAWRHLSCATVELGDVWAQCMISDCLPTSFLQKWFVRNASLSMQYWPIITHRSHLWHNALTNTKTKIKEFATENRYRTWNFQFQTPGVMFGWHHSWVCKTYRKLAVIISQGTVYITKNGPPLIESGQGKCGYPMHK